MQKEVESVTSGAQEPLQAGEGGRGDEGRFPGLFLPLGATPASAAGPPGRRISPSHQADLLPGTLTGQLSAFFFFSPLLAPPAPTSDSQNSPPLDSRKRLVQLCNQIPSNPSDYSLRSSAPPGVLHSGPVTENEGPGQAGLGLSRDHGALSAHCWLPALRRQWNLGLQPQSSRPPRNTHLKMMDCSTWP